MSSYWVPPLNLCDTDPAPLTRAPREGQGPSIEIRSITKYAEKLFYRFWIYTDSMCQDRRFGVGLHWFWYAGPNMSSRYKSYTPMDLCHIYPGIRDSCNWCSLPTGNELHAPSHCQFARNKPVSISCEHCTVYDSDLIMKSNMMQQYH